MTLPVTLGLVAALVVLMVFAGWRGSLRWNPARGVRMAPWRMIMLLSAAGVFFLLIHLAALLGAPMRPMA